MSQTQAAPQTQESQLQALTCLTICSSSLGSWAMIWAIRDWSGTGRLPKLLLRGLARGRLPLPPSKLTRLLRLGPALPALHSFQASDLRVGICPPFFCLLPSFLVFVFFPLPCVFVALGACAASSAWPWGLGSQGGDLGFRLGLLVLIQPD